MNETRLDLLRVQWDRLLGSLGVQAEKGSGDFDALVKAHSDPGRYYHNLDHIEAVLHTIELLADKAQNLPVVRLAGWYHDAVYDSRAADNEERSAVLAEAACAAWGLASEVGTAVARLIRATRIHQAEEDDVDACVLLDADLAILGAEPAEYDVYAEAIRREYAWVTDADYRAGRARVLRGFLQRERIFRLEQMRCRCEQRARDNLAREIEILTLGPS